MYVPLWIAPENPAPHAAFRYSAFLPFVVGGGIYLWCVWDFATFGRGTPAPIDMPKKLVVRGLYNIVRNPMYVGVSTFILGWAVYFASWALLGYAAAVWLMFHSLTATSAFLRDERVLFTGDALAIANEHVS